MGEANLQTLIELERMTRLMLEQAQLAAWQQVEAIEEQRRNILRCGFTLTEPLQEPLKIQTHLKKIIELNNQVMALAGTCREELGINLSRFSQGRKANQAYQHHAFFR